MLWLIDWLIDLFAEFTFWLIIVCRKCNHKKYALASQPLCISNDSTHQQKIFEYPFLARKQCIDREWDHANNTWWHYKPNVTKNTKWATMINLHFTHWLICFDLIILFAMNHTFERHNCVRSQLSSQSHRIWLIANNGRICTTNMQFVKK